MCIISFEEAARRWRSERRWDIEGPWVRDSTRSGGPSADTLRKIATEFDIARNFPRWVRGRAKESDEYEWVAERIARSCRDLAPGTMRAATIQLANDLSQLTIPGSGRPFTTMGRPPISAASKWIWFANPGCGIILDERAYGAMRRLLGRRPRVEGRAARYGWYCHGFERVFEFFAEELNACARRMGIPGTPSWAARKLLDVWLYYNGTPAAT